MTTEIGDVIFVTKVQTKKPHSLILTTTEGMGLIRVMAPEGVSGNDRRPALSVETTITGTDLKKLITDLTKFLEDMGHSMTEKDLSDKERTEIVSAVHMNIDAETSAAINGETHEA